MPLTVLSYSIRDLKLALTREREWMDVPWPEPTLDKPNEAQLVVKGIHGERTIRAMFKMIIAAYQTDATRVISYRMSDAGLLMTCPP